MKRFIIIGLVTTAVLMLRAPQASAYPAFGRDWNRRHGWIVWADNDRGYWIRTTCHWYAGRYWTWRIKLPPHWYKWTTSDSGSWGNHKPVNLRCKYVRLY
jgi:hypothetical protein